jgi:acyl-CoA synthetase (AMP-forming)/AMP-acid ligase II
LTRAPATDWPPTAPAVVRRAATEFGARDLLIGPGARLTFAGAELRSRRLARRLLAAGAGKGTRVGMQFSYSLEFVVSLLAAARIGAVAVPLSTAYSPAELRAAIRRGDVDTLLVAPRVVGRDELRFLEEAVPELAGGARVEGLPYLRQVWVLGPSDRPWAAAVDLDDDDAGAPEALLAAVEAEVSPADWFVVIQTSGSTAEPKGVIHTQGAAFRKTAGPSPIAGPIFLAMPFFWVGGLLVLCGALQSGTTLVCQERFDPAEALDLIEEHRVSLVSSWFTVTHALRTHPSAGARDLSCIPSLLQDPGERPYVTPLGMTETFGPHMTFPHPDHGMDPPAHLWGSNGVTAPFFEHRLLDPDTGAVIDGDGEGELCVRGYAVTVGMYKREREEVFDADGWYRTGDRVARREGLWFFTGRVTEMIKTRGANVAPPEVEAVLEALPDVQHAFVLGLPHEAFEEQVAAVVVARDGRALDLDAVRAAAAGALSGYKVPRVLIELAGDEVPWLATGKPDKRAMRALFATAPTRSAPGGAVGA